MKLSIVILNWNGSDMMKKYLPTVIKHSEKDAKVIVADNAGAWLLSNNRVDLFITGADRIALNGDTANKIGTFEKAIVAKNFGVPFYVAAVFRERRCSWKLKQPVRG